MNRGLDLLVPSLELCQQLKEVGFPQDTALKWVCDDDGAFVIPANSDQVVLADLCAAPTAEEILRVLPVLIQIRESFAGLQSWVSTSSDFSFNVGWQCVHPHGEREEPWYGANKFSESAAQAYLWWMKETKAAGIDPKEGQHD